MDLSDFAAFDVRSIDGEYPSAFSLGVAKVREGVVVHKQHWTFRPAAEVPQAQEDRLLAWALESAPPFAQLWPHIQQYLGADTLMAHQSDFATDQMAALLDLYELDLDPRPVLSSVELTQQVLPHLDSYDLAYLSEIMDLPDFSPTSPADTAEACARLAVRVMQGFTEPEYEDAIWRSMFRGRGATGDWWNVPMPRTGLASDEATGTGYERGERGTAA